MNLYNCYCYSDICPVRTKKEPWPRSDGIYKYIKTLSKKGNVYYRKTLVCVHCGNKMRFVGNGFDES